MLKAFLIFCSHIPIFLFFVYVHVLKKKQVRNIRKNNLLHWPGIPTMRTCDNLSDGRLGLNCPEDVVIIWKISRLKWRFWWPIFSI